MSPDLDNVRSVAAWVIDQVLEAQSSADRFLRQAERRFDGRDRRLLRELVLGTLRWLRRLDHVIGSASSRPFQAIDRELRSPLRVGAYQILFLDRVPPHAAVNEAVEDARRRSRGNKGPNFVNAVLRKLAKEPRLEAWPVTESGLIRRLGIETSHSDFLVSRWLDRFGEKETQRLLAESNSGRTLQLLSFRDRGGPATLASRLAGDGVVTRPSKLAPMGLIVRHGDPLASSAFERGEFYIQDGASQAAALVPLPRPGERILDLAAAPGGKTFSLMAFEPAVRIIASDLDPERLAILRRNADRLQRQLPTALADGTRPPWRPVFERVVLDLPCTGTGTLRRHPELRWRVTAQQLERLCRRSLELLRAACELVVPGGVLVLVTCSLEEEENIGVAKALLAENGDFELLPLADELPPELAKFVVPPGSWCVMPGDGHDGFTVHALRRR